MAAGRPGVPCWALAIVFLACLSPAASLIPEGTAKHPGEDPAEGQDIFASFMKRCRALRGRHATYIVQNAGGRTVHCLMRIFNDKGFMREMTEGNVDVVLRKYCREKREIMECSDITLNAVRICFLTSELKIPDTIREIRDELLHFACHEAGARITAFVRSGGVECVQLNWQYLPHCISNRTIPHILTRHYYGTFPDISTLFSKENCKLYDELRKCVTLVLQQCPDSRPANIIEGLLLALKEVTPCGNTDKNMAAHLLPSLFSCSLAIFSWIMFF